MTVPSAPESLRAIAERVDGRIDALLADESARWGAVDADLADPLRIMHRLVMAGGKRLRPAFCHWAFVGAGGDPADPVVVDAGAALELLHTFALIHDDVMDGSRRRRGLDTVHLAFEARHASGEWRGGGGRLGGGGGILVGNPAFLFAHPPFGGAPPAAPAGFTDLRPEGNPGPRTEEGRGGEEGRYRWGPDQ